MRSHTPHALVCLAWVALVVAAAGCPAGPATAPSAAQATGATVAADVAVRNVSVIDVERGVAVPGQAVIIAGDRMVYVGPDAAAPLAPRAQVVDGTGLFVMPGLIDSHVHYAHPPSYGPLFLALGVALVRDMGSATSAVLSLREQLQSGTLLGPEMIATGAIVDGDPPVWPFSEPVDTPDEARAAVAKLAGAGVDQIKLYSLLKKEVYLAALAEAHKRGLKAVGHVPQAVSIQEALDAGQDTMEHLLGFEPVIARASGQPDPDTPSLRVTLRTWPLLDRADTAVMAPLYRKVAASKTAISPTIVVFRSMGTIGKQPAAGPEAELLARYTPAMFEAFWQGSGYAAAAPHAAAAVPHMQKLVAELHKAGATIVAGTDLANPYVIAGYALHQELALYQDAGIPAADVLRTATIVPAKHFGLADRLGSVATGKTASIVLLEQNPLEDIRHAMAIHTVFHRGTHYDRGALDGLLETAHKAARGEASESTTAELSLPGVEVRRGKYRTHLGKRDIGVEDFVITRVDDGYRLKAHIQPSDGFRQPSITSFHFDKGFSLREAKSQKAGSDDTHAFYRVEGSALVAEVTVDGEKKPDERHDLPKLWRFGTPYTAAIWTELSAANLSVGQKTTYAMLSIDPPNWQISRASFSLERAADGSYKKADGTSIPARRYTFTMDSTMGKLSGEIWSDENHVVLEVSADLPFGKLVTKLE